VIAYVDTSTLIKLLIDEAGTSKASTIWDQPDVLAAARIAHVETRAALAAAHRQKRISALVLTSAVEGLELLWSQLALVELDERLMHLAGDVAASYALRGYDAVHLAAAQLLDADVFSSADHRLCDAAAAAGFHVANPLAGVEQPPS